MRIEVNVPGSCGELVQGSVRGVPFLVTCPVNLYTKVTITDGGTFSRGLGEKSQLALERTLEYVGCSCFPYGITLESELPPGKGMASSSADIAAVAIGTAAACGYSLSAVETAKLAASIEPTDGVFFPGIVRMNHMTGECLTKLGIFPRFKIAIFDTGGAVDTMAFHERADLQCLNAANEAQSMAALELLEPPRTPERIAAAATLSALANQTILAKEALEELAAFGQQLGALGVNTAHSGTILGVLFAPETSAAFVERQAGRIARMYPHVTYMRSVELIAGGYTIEKR